jgi:hypothetical protein
MDLGLLYIYWLYGMIGLSVVVMGLSIVEYFRGDQDS